MIRKVKRLGYRTLHGFLHGTIRCNPFFPKKRNGKRVEYGFVSDRHLSNPELDDRLVEELTAAGIEVGTYRIDPEAYREYLRSAGYAEEYHGGGKESGVTFTEKTLEHYVSADILKIGPADVFMDVAADKSPFCEIVKRLWVPERTLRQDLKYEPGVVGDTVGGEAGDLPLEDCSIDKATLHCSLEHFEGTSDMEMFSEMSRVLRPGGTLCVLPFYVAREYTIHTDPVSNLFFARDVEFDPDARVRYCRWGNRHSRHYDIRRIEERILPNLGKLRMRVLRVENFREIDPRCCLRFVALFEKR